MGLILRTQSGDPSVADNVELSSATATATGANNVDDAIAQIVSDLTSLQVGATSLPLEPEQNVNFTVSDIALYPIDCRANSVTVSPPLSPVSGSKFALVDSRANSFSHNIIVDFASAGQLFCGTLDSYILNQNSAYASFLFVGGDIGWVVQK